MSTELDELIRDAAREPGQLPDVDAAWKRGRRRHVLRTAGLTTGIATLVLAFVVGTVTVVTNRSTEPRFLDDPPAPEGTATSEDQGAVTTGWESLTADQALERLAQAADRQAATYSEPEGLFYHYQRSESRYQSATPGRPPVITPKIRDEWIGSDGSGRILESASEPEFLTDEDEARYHAITGQPPEAHAIRMEFGPGELSVQHDSLPADADAMEVELRRRVGPEPAPEATEAPVDAKMRTAVSDLLRAPALPPDVNAALLRTAKGLQFEYLGSREDPRGRHAIVLAYETHDGWTRNELYLSPETGALLAIRNIALRPPPDSTAEPPFVDGESVFLENGIVTELPPRPDDVEDAGRGDPPPPSEGPTG